MPKPETILVNLRVTEEERSAWADAAYRVRKSRTQWMRDILNATASGIPAHKFVSTPIAEQPPVVNRANQIAAELAERAAQSGKQSGKCDNRLPKGTFCKRCGRMH